MRSNKSLVNNYSLCTFITIIIAAVIISMTFSYTSFSKEKDENDFIIKIDEVPITLPEFNRAVNKNKAYVIDYFQEKYSAEQSNGFWTTSINGEIPIDMLKEIAKEECINIKMQQIVAEEKGILKDISYQGFLQELKIENKRREEAIKNKQVVYGPSQYSEEAYFDYLLFNSKLSVKKHMKESVNEEELKQFYDMKKNELYSSKGSIKVNVINLSFLNNNKVDENLKKNTFEKMSEIKYKLENGENFEKILLEYMKTPENSELNINICDNRKNLKSPVLQAALKLKPQEISNIIEENGSFYIVKCIERKESGSRYEPYHEINKQVLMDYLEDKYEEIIKYRISKAKIELNENVYKELKVI